MKHYYRIELTARARKDLDRIPENFQIKVAKAFLVMAENPLSGKKLKGELSNNYSYNIWPYRIIYAIEKQKILILVFRIQHRKDAYK